MARDIVLRVKADTGDATASISGFASKTESVFQGVGQAIGHALTNVVGNAVSGLSGLVGDSIKAASDLNESITKTDRIFGPGAAAQIQKWSKTTAKGLGISRRSALDAASTFATFGKAAGLSDDNLADFSTSLTGLSSDFASFFNTSPEDAITAIGAALRGESEPIRRYGVLLDEATLKNRALKLGIITTTKDALTPAQKVLAAQAEILAQTGDAQGDFARTSDGLANKQRIAAAAFEDAKAKLGTALLPAMTAVATFITDKLIPAFEKIAGWVQGFADKVRASGWGDALKEVLGKIGAWLTDEAAPWLGQKALELAKAFVSWLKDPALPWLLDHLGEWLKAFGKWFVSDALPWLGQQVWKLATLMGEWVGDGIAKLMQNLPGWVESFTRWFVSDALPMLVAKMGEAALALADWVGKATAEMLRRLPGWIGGLVAWFALEGFPALLGIGAALAAKIGQGIVSGLTFMGDIGKAIIDGLIKGLWDNAGRLAGAVKDVITQTIPGWAQKVLDMGSPSKVMQEIGFQAAEGLRLGILAGQPGVAAASAGMAASMVPVSANRTATYNLNVSTLDPRAAGALVVDALKGYERANGSGWRS